MRSIDMYVAIMRHLNMPILVLEYIFHTIWHTVYQPKEELAIFMELYEVSKALAMQYSLFGPSCKSCLDGEQPSQSCLQK